MIHTSNNYRDNWSIILFLVKISILFSSIQQQQPLPSYPDLHPAKPYWSRLLWSKYSRNTQHLVSWLPSCYFITVLPRVTFVESNQPIPRWQPLESSVSTDVASAIHRQKWHCLLTRHRVLNPLKLVVRYDVNTRSSGGKKTDNKSQRELSPNWYRSRQIMCLLTGHWCRDLVWHKKQINNIYYNIINQHLSWWWILSSALI